MRAEPIRCLPGTQSKQTQRDLWGSGSSGCSGFQLGEEGEQVGGHGWALERERLGERPGAGIRLTPFRLSHTNPSRTQAHAALHRQP